MADYINLYRDYLCKEPIKQVFCGVAGLFGDFADLENGGKWSRTGSGQTPETICYSATINGEQAAGTGGVKNAVFSGGAELFNVSFLTSPIYDDHALISDQSSPGGGTITNAFFISSDAENRQSWCLRISAEIGYFGDANVYPLTYRYNQTPYDGERQTWEYTRDAGSQWSIETPETTQFGGIYLYSVTVGNISYYLLLVGAGAGGTLHPTKSSFMMLIPTAYFVDQIPKPYVGPVSKDSAEGSFMPSTPWDDSIPSRTISDANPYGFNSGNGLRLTVLPKALYSYIMQGIYTGYSDSYINAASQLIDRVIGGSGHRPADEVRAIVGGVLCCHSVPALVNYVSGIASDIRTICGYRCFPLAAAFPLAGQMIYTLDTARFHLAPRLNSFLDYEPFTAISLHVPFCGMCSLQPSQAYGNDIYLHYVVDIYSGAVSCDVHIAGTTGGQAEYKDYVYTTLQGSFATDMPVMGAGATQSPLQQIAKGVTGITTAQLAANTATGSRAALAAADLKAAKLSAAIGAAETIETAGRGTAIGSASSEGLASYLSNRAVYVIIDRPEPSVPEGYAEMQGIPAHLGGTVGGFGGWTEFEAVDLSSVTQATQAEKEQIIRELKAGVFV